MFSSDSQRSSTNRPAGPGQSPDSLTAEESKSTATILVFHHDRETQLTLTLYLQAGGYTIYAADDWRNAFANLQQHLIDLVILDLGISHQNAEDLLHQLLSQYPNIRIVMIGEDCSVEEAVDAMKQGATDVILEPHGYLQRPFEPERIRAVVAEALHRPPPHRNEPVDYEVLMAQARQCAKASNFDQARQLLGEAIKQAPHRPEGLTLLGQITEFQGDQLEALKLYRAAIGLDPTYQPAQDNLDEAAFGHHSRRLPSFDE